MKHNVVQMKKVKLESGRLGQAELPKSTERISSGKALTAPGSRPSAIGRQQEKSLTLADSRKPKAGSGSGREPTADSRQPTLVSRTMPMKQIPYPPARTLHSNVPSFWDKMRFKVERSVLGEKVFATERRRLVGAAVGGGIAGAIIHAIITNKNNE